MIKQDDPVIQLIRDVRHQISESNDHDPKKLINYYLELQKKYYLEPQIPTAQSSNKSNL
jgi:vesicle coat complex subunit